MKGKKLLFLGLLACLLGCYAGSVKPLLNRPEFKAENEPLRTLSVLLISDNSYRKDEIEKFVSKCSNLVEMQVGIRLEVQDWYQIKWEDELDDISKVEVRIATDTWSKRDKFDVTLTFVYFVHQIAGGKLPLGAIDTFFWRHIFVGELDPYVLLHELFHAFLLKQGHSRDWVMRGARPPYGNEWYWLTPEDRREVLRNKWRDFNVMPTTGQEEEKKSKESWFYSKMGLAYLQKKEFEQAISLFNKSLEINPRYAEAYISRGRAYYFKGEYDKFAEDIKRAQDLGHNIPPGFLEDLRKASGREN
jgi:tetratricopeptide (TPR) repeat protein